MDKTTLKQMVDEGKSIADISILTGLAKTPVRYWLAKYGFKTKWKKGQGWPKTRRTHKIEISDDQARAMQAHYDNGGTYRSLLKEFSISCGPINRLIQEGRLKLRTLEEAHAMARKLGRRDVFKTDAYRRMMGERVKKRFEESPEKHPNRILANNRKRMSRPERRIYDELIRLNIPFQHNGKVDAFFVDFLFPTFGIEIDGKRWHDADKDRIRDAVIREKGIEIVRFDSQIAFGKPRLVIEAIQERLSRAVG